MKELKNICGSVIRKISNIHRVKPLVINR